MKIKPVSDLSFRQYGHLLEGYDFSQFVETLCSVTEKPTDGVIYVPGVEKLEQLEVSVQFGSNFYGGMPIQVGYCNGTNSTLNCLEYHRGCELNIAADDVILLLAHKREIIDWKLNTESVEAFFLPAGVGVVLYETTLHYAPCSAIRGQGFSVGIVLPKGTNTEMPKIEICGKEDELLFACNKWLLAHPDSPESKKGAFVGLIGNNISFY